MMCPELIAGMRDIYERTFSDDPNEVLEIRRVASTLLAKHATIEMHAEARDLLDGRDKKFGDSA